MSTELYLLGNVTICSVGRKASSEPLSPWAPLCVLLLSKSSRVSPVLSLYVEALQSPGALQHGNEFFTAGGRWLSKTGKEADPGHTVGACHASLHLHFPGRPGNQGIHRASLLTVPGKITNVSRVQSAPLCLSFSPAHLKSVGCGGCSMGVSRAHG